MLTLTRLGLVLLTLVVVQVPAWSQSDKIVTDFTIEDVDGVEANLYAELASGRYVLLDFFSPFCHICKENTRKVNQIQADYEGRLTIWKLGVGNTDREPASAIVDFNRWYDSKIRAFAGATTEHAYFIGEFGLGFGTPGYVLVAPDRTVEFVTGGFREGTLRAGLNEAGLSPTSVTDLPDVSAEVLLSPQPASEILTIDIPADARVRNITIADAEGNLLMNIPAAPNPQFNSSPLAIDLSTLQAAAGVYLLRLEFADNTLAQKSFVLVR